MKIYNLIGQVFGKLTVMSYGGTQGEGSGIIRKVWLCSCECGNELLVSTSSLITGHTKSCGCLIKEVFDYTRKHRKHKIITTQDVITFMYKRYKRSAKTRNLSFLLDIVEFTSLVEGECVYCGRIPKKFETGDCTEREFREGNFYNGIDRLDNNVGYESSNCASCCKICNRMKGTLETDVFIRQMRNINNNLYIKSLW